VKRLSDAALAVLSSGVSVDGNELRISGKLDRKIYAEVNAALEAIGGKWSRKAKMHLFDADPTDALDQILVDGAFADKKRDLDQFFTPPALAQLVVERAQVRGKTVLEPSAGHGALAWEAAKQHAVRVDCVEADPECVLRLKARGFAAAKGDFMLVAPHRANMYDRVVMNPPFSRQKDIDHVLAALTCVRDGGRLVAIMSAGVTFRTDKKAKNFRDIVNVFDGTIEKLPDSSFRESGTNVNTVLVTLEKK
jgi:predicted RNA methylase